jgi:plasmid maintenance system antidote protein VapI
MVSAMPWGCVHRSSATNNRTTEAQEPRLIVRATLDRLGLSTTDAAKRTGVGRIAMSNFLNGKSPLSARIAVLLERRLGMNAADLWKMQCDMDLAAAYAVEDVYEREEQTKKRK